MFWWFSRGTWVGPLIGLAFWAVVIAAAVILLRREVPHLQSRTPTALRLLEERYARGEIGREEFLHRRDTLLRPHGPGPSPPSPDHPPVPQPPPAPQPPPGPPTPPGPPSPGPFPHPEPPPFPHPVPGPFEPGS
ncbi:MAG TPA: hypothetical protein DIT48_02105 [Actinobacteria bacterium]|nr:hypothetical protein [Actinomycetota bacterium]HCP62833.1 hypothetical protein [Actinomycetota bacterium]